MGVPMTERKLPPFSVEHRALRLRRWRDEVTGQWVHYRLELQMRHHFVAGIRRFEFSMGRDTVASLIPTILNRENRVPKDT